jgi:hypothetical protein
MVTSLFWQTGASSVGGGGMPVGLDVVPELERRVDLAERLQPGAGAARTVTSP